MILHSIFDSIFNSPLPENPLRTILGGLSVTDEVDDEDEDGAIDAEKVKAARNSKKNLRKARIELLFNEYEEEIEDLREELKDAKEQNGRTADELRDVKEALATAKKNADDGPPASSAPSSARDPHTTALLAELTAKLQEANDTYSKVLKDVDALKKENATLKEEKVIGLYLWFCLSHLFVLSILILLIFLSVCLSVCHSQSCFVCPSFYLSLSVSFYLSLSLIQVFLSCFNVCLLFLTGLLRRILHN